MRNNFEHILLSLLLGISTLLGLSFWLNTYYGFNLFYSEHWDELSKLQASKTPINNGFYVSIIIAVLVFIIGIYIIYSPKKHTHISKQNNPVNNNISQPINATKPEIKDETSVPMPNIMVARPPRLKLPTNMAKIIEQRQQTQPNTISETQKHYQENQYTPVISKIFSDNGYLVKPNPKISGFTPNLFAIGPNEILWIGAIDAEIKDMQRAIEKLQSVFQETLEDIQINITPFILETSNQQQTSDSILIFKTIDELKTFMDENPAEPISDEERDNFDSYSEYIDTVTQYIKNI